MRLSAYLAQQNGFSRRYAKELISNGKIIIDGITTPKDINVYGGVSYSIISDDNSINLDIDLSQFLVSDRGEIVFYYKPPLMHTERHSPADPVCLDDIVKLSHLDHNLLSRLDFGVDGIIAAAHKDLAIIDQSKVYLAWVEGKFPKYVQGRWDIDACKRRKVKVHDSYHAPHMALSLVDEADNCSLIEVSLEIAHRHQVRAVCAHLGHPIIGDYIYGSATVAGRVELHCQSIEINGIHEDSPKSDLFRKLHQ
jgi:23S rRNA pseudouridine1911/1915/1917 synthase